MTVFPILDYDREDTAMVIDAGHIEPLVDELDEFIALPVRLSFGYRGLLLELGPYTLTEVDVRVLREALELHADVERQVW